MKQIYIFTAKEIGVNCVKFLLEKFPYDNYKIIVCDPEKENFVEAFHNIGAEADFISEDVIKNIKRLDKDSIDWLLNLWGSHIFDGLTLSKFKNTLNIHPSLLPYCRGRDPVVWALRYGLPAGVSLHEISPNVDEGAIWCQEPVSYEFPCKGIDLYETIVERSFGLFCDNWPKIRGGSVMPVPQESVDQKTFKRKDLYLDKIINAEDNSTALELVRRILAHDFNENYSATLDFEGKKYSVRLQVDRDPGDR